MHDIISLLRIHQWYKNLLIFIPLVFTFNLFNLELVVKTFIGFIALCFVSSSYYIINDVVDRKKDIHHPEKKSRPIASGKISVNTALLISVILLFVSLGISYSLSTMFFVFVAGLFLNTMVYTFWLKQVVFADAISVSINFLIKPFSGIFILSSPLSLWIVITAFFLSLLLVFGKRYAEKMSLGKEQTKYKVVLKDYTKVTLDSLIAVSSAGFLISFAVYTVLVAHNSLVTAVPVLFYVTAYYLHSIYREPKIARNPEKVLRRPAMIAGLLILFALGLVSLYII